MENTPWTLIFFQKNPFISGVNGFHLSHVRNYLVILICLVETLVRMIQSTFAQFPTNEDGIGIMPEDEERFMVLAAQV